MASCALIDEEYTSRLFYGRRRMAVFLRGRGHRVNRKRMQRLMREMDLAGMAPGPATSKPHSRHKVHPYLLRGLAITKPNQVWSMDLTYIHLARGFAYLVAVIDWYSRRVLAWRINNSMDASFCVDCLEDALRDHGRPEVFKSGQGHQEIEALLVVHARLDRQLADTGICMEPVCFLVMHNGGHLPPILSRCA